jgi:PAS domain S-box-containing protein
MKTAHHAQSLYKGPPAGIDTVAMMSQRSSESDEMSSGLPMSDVSDYPTSPWFGSYQGSRVKIRNTFLETVEDWEQDALECDIGFNRAVTDPSHSRTQQNVSMSNGGEVGQPAYVGIPPKGPQAPPGNWNASHQAMANASFSARQMAARSPQVAMSLPRAPQDSGTFLPTETQAMDVVWAAQAAQDLEMTVSEQATLSAIRNMPAAIGQLPWAVTLADPSMNDCPLIGCSHTFETMTGYAWAEIIGQNCRFLNKGTTMQPSARMKLREAVRLGKEFIGILPNVKKNGEKFRNLLHMSMLEVRGKKYIIGIQADVTNMDVNPDNPGHIRALADVAEKIFSNNLDVWVQIQAREFSIRLPAPYSQLLKLCGPADFQKEQQKFVKFCAVGTTLQHFVEAIPEESNYSSSTPKSKASSKAKAQNTSGRSGDDNVHEDDAKSEKANSVHLSGIRSAGASLHPNNCTECHFFMFNPGGCRAGKDCTFCHELHPRKSAKKNRRFIKRLVESGLIVDAKKPDGSAETEVTEHVSQEEADTSSGKEEEVAEIKEELWEGIPSATSTATGPEFDDDINSGGAWCRQTTNESVATHNSVNSQGVDFISLQYGKVGFSSASGYWIKLVLALFQ